MKSCWRFPEDRNGRVLAGKGTASSVGIVPGKFENREEAIAQIAELLEITPEGSDVTCE